MYQRASCSENTHLHEWTTAGQTPHFPRGHHQERRHASGFRLNTDSLSVQTTNTELRQRKVLSSNQGKTQAQELLSHCLKRTRPGTLVKASFSRRVNTLGYVYTGIWWLYSLTNKERSERWHLHQKQSYCRKCLDWREKKNDWYKKNNTSFP